MHRTCATLKTLVDELVKYFVVCEEEINNTLITEVLKRQLSNSVDNERTMQTDETEKSKNKEANFKLNTSQLKIRRVHFAPQTTEIISIINSNNETLQNIFKENDGITEKLKQELNSCVRRLKSESAEILGTSSNTTMSSTTSEDQHSALAKEIAWMNKVNEELNSKLLEAESLIMNYQEETEQLKVTILDLQRKLINIESKKEIITEGYGENDEVGAEITLQNFSQLQEKGTSSEFTASINTVRH